MAQFNTDLTVKPTQYGSNIGDMLNIARGAQAYQQAQQINPLEVRQQQAQTKKIEAVTPLDIERAGEQLKQSKLQTETSQFNLNSGQLGYLKESAMRVANHPEILKGNTKEIVRLLGEAEKESSNIIPNATLRSSIFQPLIMEAEKNPERVVRSLRTLGESNIGAQGQQALQTPQTFVVNGVTYQVKPGTNEAVPIGQGAAQPSAQPTTQPAAPAAPATPSGTSLIANETILPATTIPQLNMQQKEAYDFGTGLKRDALARVQPAEEGKQTVRKIKEYINKASGSRPGQLIRSAGKFIAGSEELEILTKNLADLQVRNAQLMGAGTDAARETISTISGSADLTPAALNQIVDRADASNTAVIKFNKALKQYETKRGHTNSAVNASNLQQSWAENYDPRIFMVQNINASNMSPAEKKLEISKILKELSASEIETLRKKSENLKRLENGDYK
jgi:hypothetical protein